MKYKPTKARWSKMWHTDRAEFVALANKMKLAEKCSATCKRRRQCSPSLSWVDKFHWNDNQLCSMGVVANPPCMALLVDRLDDKVLEAEGYKRRRYG